MNCWKCGTAFESLEFNKIYRSDSCSDCNSDLHVCKNCQFYAPGHHNECQETQAEWVSEKERSNFCDYFQVSEKDHKGLQKKSSVSKGKIKATFDQLFAE